MPKINKIKIDKYLTKSTHDTILGLNNSDVQIEDLEYLNNNILPNTVLTVLSLQNNRLDDAAADIIIKLLVKCTSITKILLNGNAISGDKLAHITQLIDGHLYRQLHRYHTELSPGAITTSSSTITFQNSLPDIQHVLSLSPPSSSPTMPLRHRAFSDMTPSIQSEYTDDAERTSPLYSRSLPELQGLFVSRLSDGLKNPLAIINTNAQLLEKNLMTDQKIVTPQQLQVALEQTRDIQQACQQANTVLTANLKKDDVEKKKEGKKKKTKRNKLGSPEFFSLGSNIFTDIIILVTDDNELIRRSLKAILERLGVKAQNINFASNGKAAIQRVKEKRFDVIFMDVNMPDIDGFVTSMRIRAWQQEQKQNKTPIIIHSAELDLEEKISHQQLEGYLKKPYTLQNLENEMKKVLSLDNTTKKEPQPVW